LIIVRPLPPVGTPLPGDDDILNDAELAS